MEIAGKVMVVVGAGNGIGQQVVLELVARRARVAAIDLREDGLAKTAALAGAGDRLASFPTDITDRDAVEALPGHVTAALGAPDGLINVAGIIQPFVRLAELDYDTIHRVMDVNLYGTLHTVKAFLPGLLARPEAHVANVSSMGGFLPVPGQTIYGASKAAVRLLTEGLYAELRDTDVGVSIVFPGAVRTGITANSGVDGPAPAAGKRTLRMTEPDMAAETIVDAVEANRLYVHIGRDARLMSLLTRLAPRRATHLIHRQMKELLRT